MLPKRYLLPEEKAALPDRVGSQVIKQHAQTREVRDVTKQTAIGAAALYGGWVQTTAAQELRGRVKSHALDVADRANREGFQLIEQAENPVHRARLEGLDERLDDELGTSLLVYNLAYAKAATRVLDRDLIRELPEPKKGLLPSMKAWLFGDDKV